MIVMQYIHDDDIMTQNYNRGLNATYRHLMEVSTRKFVYIIVFVLLDCHAKSFL